MKNGSTPFTVSLFCVYLAYFPKTINPDFGSSVPFICIGFALILSTYAIAKNKVSSKKVENISEGLISSLSSLSILGLMVTCVTIVIYIYNKGLLNLFGIIIDFKYGLWYLLNCFFAGSVFNFVIINLKPHKNFKEKIPH